MDVNRRKFINHAVKAGSLAVSAPFLIQRALAMGDRMQMQGFRKLDGQVLHNGKPAKLGGIVTLGDSISTGKNGMAVFVVDQDAFLLRSDSQLEISAASNAIKTLTLLTGKMLSVFGKGEKKILLPTATIGIRGTAVYSEADPIRSYLCTCYGTVSIQSNQNVAVQETVVSKHHDQPRYIYASGEKLISKAPAINHKDDELFMLEALVGRMPDFYGPGYDPALNSY